MKLTKKEGIWKLLCDANEFEYNHLDGRVQDQEHIQFKGSEKRKTPDKELHGL